MRIQNPNDINDIKLYSKEQELTGSKKIDKKKPKKFQHLTLVLIISAICIAALAIFLIIYFLIVKKKKTRNRYHYRIYN